jgi:hypothetical protein
MWVSSNLPKLNRIVFPARSENSPTLQVALFATNATKVSIKMPMSARLASSALRARTQILLQVLRAKNANPAPS